MNALARVFVEEPESEAIAEVLNAERVRVCRHLRNPCFSRCGVVRIDGVWVPIPPDRRFEWLGTVFGAIFRDREMAAVRQ